MRHGLSFSAAPADSLTPIRPKASRPVWFLFAVVLLSVNQSGVAQAQQAEPRIVQLTNTPFCCVPSISSLPPAITGDGSTVVFAQQVAGPARLNRFSIAP